MCVCVCVCVFKNNNVNKRRIKRTSSLESVLEATHSSNSLCLFVSLSLSLSLIFVSWNLLLIVFVCLLFVVVGIACEYHLPPRSRIWAKERRVCVCAYTFFHLWEQQEQIVSECLYKASSPELTDISLSLTYSTYNALQRNNKTEDATQSFDLLKQNKKQQQQQQQLISHFKCNV